MLSGVPLIISLKKEQVILFSKKSYQKFITLTKLGQEMNYLLLFVPFQIFPGINRYLVKDHLTQLLVEPNTIIVNFKVGNSK